MKQHINLSAYNNIEDLNNFTETTFQNYCEDKLKSCQKHISFIKNLPIKNNNLNVLEFGSGNGKLLYALEKENMLESAVGIEISKSRFNFAQKFKEYIKSSRVTNINKNIFDVKEDKKYDLILGTDIVLQLISPIDYKAEERLLQFIKNSLTEDGYLILELWSFEKILQQLALSNNFLQTWEDFPSSDPFKYILSKIYLDEDGYIRWNKLFIKRDSFEESIFDNILKPYSKKLITDILQKHGFKDIRIFDYWFEEDDCLEDEYIVIAKL